MKVFSNKGKLFGIIIIASSLGLIIFQALQSGSSVTFYTPEEIYKDVPQFEKKMFRVSGLVMKDSKKYQPETQKLEFKITDMVGHDFNVQYTGVPPDLFKEGQGVVVEGRLLAGGVNDTLPGAARTIHASLLMVKHSEVYDTKQEHSKMREAKLLDSMIK